MVRIARVIAPGIPHHVTQRGNRRQRVFFCDADYEYYLQLMHEWGQNAGLTVLAFCLMPNHVHIIAIPPTETALTQVMSEVHRRYSRTINQRNHWVGHLWQGRYSSYPLSEKHLYNAINYIEMNPVKAFLAVSPKEWKWSSANEEHQYLCHGDTRNEQIHRYPAAHGQNTVEQDFEIFKRHERTGRPLGDLGFLRELEGITGRDLVPKKAGRKAKLKK